MGRNDIVVTIAHCRAAGYCVRGTRRHARLLEIDFRRLVKEGLPISDVEGIDDVAVQRIIAVAREQQENRHG